MTRLQTFTYTMAAPGPVPNRQDAPHPHETILDPTEQYLLVNDLGADLVRIYAINADNTLTTTPPLNAKPGSGPRHAAFSLNPISGEYVFYLAAEIASTVTAYRVSYLPNMGGLNFSEIAAYDSLGPGHPIPATTTGESTGVAAEIALSPDGRFVVVSNRRDLSFDNGTSDSMATWSIEPKHEGALDFLELFPAGGSYPRQFSINKGGNLVAVGLQNNGTVVILERNAETGAFVQQVAQLEVGGPITCVVWDE